MSTRQRLNNRHRNDSKNIESNGMRFHLTVGYFPSGEIGEIFINSDRANSTLDAFISDAAIITSIALQFGAPLSTIRHALKRDGKGEAASPIGAVLDAIEAAL